MDNINYDKYLNDLMNDNENAYFFKLLEDTIVNNGEEYFDDNISYEQLGIPDNIVFDYDLTKSTKEIESDKICPSTDMPKYASMVSWTCPDPNQFVRIFKSHAGNCYYIRNKSYGLLVGVYGCHPFIHNNYSSFNDIDGSTDSEGYDDCDTASEAISNAKLLAKMYIEQQIY